LIVKSEHKYDHTSQRRLAALRNHTILTLEKNGGTYSIGKLMEETGTKFSQISSFVNDLVNISQGVMTLKSYPDTKFKAKLSK